MNLKGYEWLILLLIVLLLFGARRLPDLARSVGRSMRILKHEVTASEEPNGSDADGDQPKS